ncbi:MAG: divalent-cation tolerance protein CutA [Candidatus Sumerlaeia bacterium]|nr:divalent-cation tolerance protein CutA [Candidatus Sumerlaeia bacterium]
MQEITLLYIPCPSEEEACRIARHLLDARLVACANWFPIRSMYWWEAALAEEGEVVLLAKTLPAKADAVEAAIRAVHPYQVPCIARVAACVNEEYGRWMEKEVDISL